MAVNKFQFKRLSLLHGLFLSYTRISLADLLTILNNRLDTDKQISKRTLFLDIALLKELGAPIIKESKYYQYAEAFSLYEVFNPTETELMREAVDLLKRIASFDYVKEFLPEIENLVLKLNLHESQTRKIIFFDHNDQYQGIELLSVLYNHIDSENVLHITYVDFENATFHYILHPYILKEYNMRWYVFGQENESGEIYRFPLDRIRKIELASKDIIFKPNQVWNVEQHFAEMVGISREIGQEPEIVKLRAYGVTADYLLTKPIHTSQQLINESKAHSDFELLVVRNYELEAVIRSFGSQLEEF
jgi:predicted DNA-binding transcriptional regulator YafY